MSKAYLTSRRAEYLFFGLKQYCIGNKTECTHFEAENAMLLPWGKTPDTNDFTQIEVLRILPTLKQIKKAEVPSFIRHLPNLRFLELPLPMALNLDQKSLPGSLKTLMITNKSGYVELLKEEKKSIRWPTVVFTNLTGLWFFNTFDSTELDSLLQSTPESFPSLEYLECKIDKKGKILQEIQRIHSLQFLNVENVNNFDIFSVVTNSLKSISIIGTKKDIPFNTISNLKNLEMVWLNGIQTEIDCSVFTQLSKLIEINLLNSKKIINAATLLECPNLKSLFVLDCNNPFKGIKDKFLDTNYERLNIKYA